MIPLSLYLRNFLSYGMAMEPLNFDGIRLACLSGENGHGKSALLDAMTWALWGRARASRDDDLMRLGASEMQVEFEFALGPNRYRVLRSRQLRVSSSGRVTATPSLELAVWADGEYQAISEPTISQTQARIIDLLRMDYETFVNSAFLVQGKADAFTVKTPGERKRILAEILGLELYDRCEVIARERSREMQMEITAVEARIAEIDRELERRPVYQAQELEAASQVAALSEQLQTAERKLSELQRQRQALIHQQQQLQDVQSRVQRAEGELGRLKGSLSESQTRLAKSEELLAQRDAIEAGYQGWRAARKELEEWHAKLAAQARLQSQINAVERTISEVRHGLQSDVRLLEERCNRWQTLVADIPKHEAALAEAQSRVESLASIQADLDEARQRLDGLTEEGAALNMTIQQLQAQIAATDEKLTLLAAEGGEAGCPLCGQPLSAEDLIRVQSELTAEKEQLVAQLRIGESRRAALRREYKEAKAQIDKLESEIQSLHEWRHRVEQARRALVEGQDAAAELDKDRLRVEALRAQLEREEFAPGEQKRLRDLRNEIGQLGYDAQKHQAVAQVAEQGAIYEEQYSELQRAMAGIEAERRAIEQMERRRESLEEELVQERAQCAALEKAVAELPRITQAVQEQDQHVAQLEREERAARDALAAALQRLHTCDRLAEDRSTRVAEVEKLSTEKGMYDELRVAFGKKGVQAMMIESAIPELEAEANQLLNRMTDGRMSVRLETQRSGKTVDTIETLDILISDELGTRPYELFSGGEAFRANLAVRIALSKLLARRAGASLQTLIIDEGFGTQDSQGRERLVDAINSIQDDFERILVITHIDELKDLFPVRIDVYKDHNGSNVRIV